MVRSIPPGRLRHLVEVATATFIARGYRQTQMADVAQSLGVAKGTLYGYVESKEALFDAAVRFADRCNDLPGPDALPMATPLAGATVRYVRERLAAEAAEMSLAHVLTGALTIDDPAEELHAILGDLYDRLARNRHALKLVDRCAVDYPELADVWFGQGRWAQHELLAALIHRRVADGGYRPVGDVEIVARTLLETTAFWALHRHFDPSPRQVDDDHARRAMIDLFAHGLTKERS